MSTQRTLPVARTAEDLRVFAAGVLVPTMGGLHEGHATLVDLARREADRRDGAPVVVSVFVNPRQFEEPHDYERYPRVLDEDAGVCAAHGADCVFAPTVEEVYPPGVSVADLPTPPVASEPGLEDQHRPGHLEGVCQVVHRLFQLARPAAAVFGEKDWQQLQLARALSRERGLGVQIIPAPTVREPDGLAMSSRNRFIRPEDRPRAGAISRALRESSEEATPTDAERRMRAILDEAGAKIDYAAVRDAETLLEPAPPRPARALIAARFGDVRLIDNMPWTPAV